VKNKEQRKVERKGDKEGELLKKKKTKDECR
jgi:hypothetical protein